MKHIKKISINNARRLGNFEIDFDSGATIILAPNGTGKTTIFEAIELALTGTIKRIENYPDTIIRDGLSEMDVRLEFSEGKYFKTNLIKGGIITQEGDYSELIEIDNKSSLPYLFRLTHFLEQSGKEWFVEQDYKGAGNLLSKLPLGRELHNIISKKTSLLRAIGSAENIAYNAFQDAKKKLQEFEELIAKRDGLDIVTSLTPLSEIAMRLLPISELVSYRGYDADYSVELMNNYFEKIRVLFRQENARKNDLIIKLNVLKERVRLYYDNSDLLKQKDTVISDYTKKIDELNFASSENQKKIEDEKIHLSDIRDEIKKINFIKDSFEDVEKKRVNLSIAKEELEQNEKNLKAIKNSYEYSTEYLKRVERIRDQHKLANEEILRQKNHLPQVEQMKEVKRQWESIASENQEIIYKKVPDLEKRKTEFREEKIHFDIEVAEAEKAYLLKKNTLESLNKASSAIQNAVGCIRMHISENQRKCPVCQAEYEHDELIKRIEGSLNTINPIIPQTIIDEKNALEVLNLAKQNQFNVNKKLHDVEVELNILNDKHEVNKKIIIERFISSFPGCKDPEEANASIEKMVSEITMQILNLEVNKSKLEPEVDVDEINSAYLKMREQERTIHELNYKNENILKVVLSETENIKLIEELLSGREKESVISNLYIMLGKEAEVKEVIQKNEEALATIESLIKEIRSSIINENDAISKIKGSQEGICTEWVQTGFLGEPNEENLKVKYDEVMQFLRESEKADANLNIIEQELVAWSTAEKFKEADNKIKMQIGNISEETYIESLKKIVNQSSITLQNIIEKKNAVNIFLSNAAEEYEQIHEQLNLINEPWKKLLKRIVINPLISKAPLLSNTTSRNIPLAKISATIHHQNRDIATIASEAQLSDLQLTFMLAMANKFKWTKLKALLLDDPTQHHDLVHATSVFDVLRDYIIDFDYQIMMSTHDTMQADFFHRKLENEGISSKVYRLVARECGVVAERMA